VSHCLKIDVRPDISSIRQKAVNLTDGDDLLDMVHTVNELEPAPLIDAERTEDHVAGAAAGRAEEIFGLGEELVETAEVFGDGLRKSFAGERKGGRRRRNQLRGFTAGWEVAKPDERVLTEVLQKVGFGAGWRALSEAGVDGGLGAGVGEKQVLDDLLDAPLAGAREWAELGLRGIEPAEGVGELAIEALQIGVHMGRITLHASLAEG
jgi:hypothetical protein